MNKYRVDRSNYKVTPCGMNSLLYVGDNWNEATKAFNNATPGYNSWGKENPAYGVLLSVWCGTRREYIVKLTKGFTIPNMHGTY